MTAEDVKRQLRDALDGIELLNNVEREHLMDWVDSNARYRDVGIARFRSLNRHSQQMRA